MLKRVKRFDSTSLSQLVTLCLRSDRTKDMFEFLSLQCVQLMNGGGFLSENLCLPVNVICCGVYRNGNQWLPVKQIKM